MQRLLIMAVFVFGSQCYAATNQRFAVNNLCQNLTAACTGGDQASCQAAKNTGCKCDESQGTCTRGNYSN